MRKKIKALAIVLMTMAVIGGCENTKSSDEDEPTDNAPVSFEETDDQEENDDVPEDEPAGDETVSADDDIVETEAGELPYYSIVTTGSGHKGVIDYEGKELIEPKYATIIPELEFADAMKGTDVVSFLVIDDKDDLNTYAWYWPDDIELGKGVAEKEEDDKKVVPEEEFCASGEAGVELYADYIGTDDFYDGFYNREDIRLALIFLDDDDIPELVAMEGKGPSPLVKIWTVGNDGAPEELITFSSFYGSFRYGERSSVVEMVYGNQGKFTCYYLKAGRDGVRYMGAALEDGGGPPYAPENTEYQTDIQLPDDIIAGLESDRRYFRDHHDPRYDHDIPNGRITDKAGYEEYCYGLMKDCRSVTYERPNTLFGGF